VRRLQAAGRSITGGALANIQVRPAGLCGATGAMAAMAAEAQSESSVASAGRHATPVNTA